MRKHLPDTDALSFREFPVALLFLMVFSFLYLGPPFWALATTTSNTLNQAALNGTYSFIKSVDQHDIYKESIPDYHFCADSAAINGLKQAIIKQNEQPLSSNLPTLRKINNTQPFLKKNIVIVIMESFSARYIGCLNEDHKGFSPYFDKISQEGILFTSCRSNGPRSQHGIISTVSGFPAIQGINLQRRKGVNPFETLGSILVSEGYNTQFIHNGDAGFDDMSDFFSQGGFEKIIDIKDFKTWRVKNEWGISDEDLYDKAETLIWSHEKKPTLSVLMTVSNHAPNEVPNEFRKQHPEINKMTKLQASFYYSDYALGKFIEHCKRNPEYKNTLFLVLADHGAIYDPDDGDYNIFRIPALLLNTSKEPGRFNDMCAQCDFATTILHEINYPGQFHFVGQDLFSKDFKPFAFSRPYGNEILFSSDTLVLKLQFETGTPIFYRLRDQKYLTEVSNQADKHLKEINFVKQYLQSTSFIFKNGKYTSAKGF
ncbi:MAG: LTA synthase family protein [Bacteroidetes bacterium]|nr:LTA synthase family protein [Bacteroidota bacterium]